MEGYCSTSQSPQWAVVPMEEEENAQNIFPRFTIQVTTNLMLIHTSGTHKTPRCRDTLAIH
jgi:hypothetical protein